MVRVISLCIFLRAAGRNLRDIATHEQAAREQPLTSGEYQDIFLPKKPLLASTRVGRMRRFGKMARTAYFSNPNWTRFNVTVLKSNSEAEFHRPVYHVLRSEVENRTFVIIRGTNSFADGRTVADAPLVEWPNSKASVGLVHNGYLEAAKWIYNNTVDAIGDAETTVVGHSLGGAVGIYLTLLLRGKGKECDCITFGSPPTLQQPFANKMDWVEITSVVNVDDDIPRFHSEASPAWYCSLIFWYSDDCIVPQDKWLKIPGLVIFLKNRTIMDPFPNLQEYENVTRSWPHEGVRAAFLSSAHLPRNYIV